MVNNMVNFPYNSLGVARVDSNGVVHNHIYHQCPVGRVDSDGVVYNHPTNYSPVGRVDKDGFVYNKQNIKVARVEGDDLLKSAGAYLLLIDNLR